jgi:hypothetical protein
MTLKAEANIIPANTAAPKGSVSEYQGDISKNRAARAL